MKRDYVSHIVYDHTSICAFLERKWNLPAMTMRDANANDLTDFFDLEAMARRQPTFPELPALPASGDTPATEACSKTGAGTIPVPPVAQKIVLEKVRPDRRAKALLVELRANHGTLLKVEVELLRGHKILAKHTLARVSAAQRRVLLRIGGRAPAPGDYTVVVRLHGKTVVRRAARVG